MWHLNRLFLDFFARILKLQFFVISDMIMKTSHIFNFTGLGATLNVAKPKKGSSVAVFGLGAVGLAVSSMQNYLFIYSSPRRFTLSFI